MGFKVLQRSVLNIQPFVSSQEEFRISLLMVGLYFSTKPLHSPQEYLARERAILVQER
jgi:hypothetical protein